MYNDPDPIEVGQSILSLDISGEARPTDNWILNVGCWLLVGDGLRVQAKSLYERNAGKLVNWRYCTLLS